MLPAPNPAVTPPDANQVVTEQPTTAFPQVEGEDPGFVGKQNPYPLPAQAMSDVPATAVMPVAQSSAPPSFAPLPNQTQSLSGDGGTFDQHTGAEYPDALTQPDEPHYYERPVVKRRYFIFLAATLAVIAGSALAPIITWAVLIAVLLCFRVVGVMWEAFHSRRETKGHTPRESAVAAVSFPWHLLRGIAGLLPSLLLTAACTVVLAGGLWWLHTNGTIPDMGSAGPRGTRIVIVAVTTLFVVCMMWFGPLTSLTRTGGRVAMKGLFPGAFASLIFVLLLCAIAAYLVFAVASGQGIFWWPLQGAPSFGQ